MLPERKKTPQRLVDAQKRDYQILFHWWENGSFWKFSCSQLKSHERLPVWINALRQKPHTKKVDLLCFIGFFRPDFHVRSLSQQGIRQWIKRKKNRCWGQKQTQICRKKTYGPLKNGQFTEAKQTDYWSQTKSRNPREFWFYIYLFDVFDFLITTVAPRGTRCKVWEKRAGTTIIWTEEGRKLMFWLKSRPNLIFCKDVGR